MKCRLCTLKKADDGSWEPGWYLSKNTLEFTLRNSNSKLNLWFPNQDAAYNFLIEKQLNGKAGILFDDGRVIRCDRDGYVPLKVQYPVELGDFHIERHCPESYYNDEYGSGGPYEVIRWDTSDWGKLNPLREPGYGNQRLAFHHLEEAVEFAEMLPKCEYGWSVWVCGPDFRRRLHGETSFGHLHWTEVPYKTLEERQKILSKLEERPYYLKTMPRHVDYWRKLDKRVIAWFVENKHREYPELKENPNWDINKYSGDELDVEAWLHKWVCDPTPLYKFVTEGKLDPKNAINKVGDSITFTDGDFESSVRFVPEDLSGDTIETLEDACDILGLLADDLEDHERDYAKRFLDGHIIPGELEYRAYSRGVEIENQEGLVCTWATDDSLTSAKELTFEAWEILYRCTKESLWMRKSPTIAALWDPDDRCKHAIVNIAGIAFENTDGRARREVLRECDEGELLALVPDPENEHDDNAVKICRQNGDQLGFVPACLSHEIYDLADEGYGPNAILINKEMDDTNQPKHGEIAIFFFLGGSISKEKCNKYIQEVFDKAEIDYQTFAAFRPDS